MANQFLNNYVNQVKNQPNPFYDKGLFGNKTSPKTVAAVTNPVPTPKPVSTSSQMGPVANPSATYKNPTSSLPPAGQQFVQNQIKTQTPVAPKSYTTQPIGQQIQPAQNPSQVQTNPVQSAYLKYLTGMFDPSKVDAARSQAEEQNKRLVDIQNQSEAKSLGARREYEGLLDSRGGTTSGAQTAASMANRRSTSELADLALIENAAARSAGVANDVYNQYISAGKSVYEAEQAAEAAKREGSFSLNEGERQFDAKGNQIAYGGPKSYSPKSGGISDLNELLSPAEALKLGVPYGTTKGQAAGALGGTQASSDQFYNTLQQYSDFLGRNSAFGAKLSPAKQAEKRNLIAQITALYKQKYSLGTLDAGVQKLIDGLLGSGGIASLSNQAQKSAVDSLLGTLPQANAQATQSNAGKLSSGNAFTVVEVN